MGKNVSVVTQEHKEYCFKMFGGQIPPEYRPVIRVRMKDAWYRRGQIIKVHMYGTCGAWDISGRWVDYYDLGLPIDRYPWYKRFIYRIINFFR